MRDVVFFVLSELGSDAQVSVHLIGDTRMKSLNKKYRGKDKTTDVLSFAMGDGERWFGEILDLGDVFVSIPQIRRQAREFGVSFKHELVRMLVHGILHTMGYDHLRPKDAKVMMPLQGKLVEQVIDKKMV
ncbi:rRNA maturation RNase YbeY [Candidatus Nomurabacteria bacterium]|nr:rRNA maturation RNase YbeY [Candidatus Nomurabacteria bacterium]